MADGLELRWRAFGLLDPGINDHDGDGLSTYDEVMIYGTSDTVPGDVARLLADGVLTVNFTIEGTPGPGTVLTLGGQPLPLSGRTVFSLDLPGGAAIPLALDNAPGVSVAASSSGCIAMVGGSGGMVPREAGDGTSTLEVTIDDLPATYKPYIHGKVLEPTVTPIHVFIICSNNVPAVSWSKFEYAGTRDRTCVFHV